MFFSLFQIPDGIASRRGEQIQRAVHPVPGLQPIRDDDVQIVFTVPQNISVAEPVESKYLRSVAGAKITFFNKYLLQSVEDARTKKN